MRRTSASGTWTVVTTSGEACAHRCAKRAKHFIAKHRNEDYLLVLSFDEPHHPSLCPPEFYERFQSYVPALTANMRDPLTDKPLAHRLWAEDPKLGVEVDGGLHGTAPCAESVRRYLACGAYVDMLIGEVLEVIEKNAKEALIVYTADHGELAGAHRLRGKGSAMYEENVRIPFIVRPPGGAQARDDHVVTGAGPTGRRIPSPVSHISVTPTILDFFGVAAGTFPGGSYIEGTSLLPFLLGGAAGERRDAAPRSYEPGDAVFLGFNRFQITRDTFGGFQPVRAIVEGSYKLVLNLMDTDELYDLDTDPQELCNLIAEESPELRSVRDNLHDRLLAWMDQTLDPYRGYLWGARPWRSDRHATWKDSGLARQRWDEVYDERQIDYRTGLPFGDHRTYSQY